MPPLLRQDLLSALRADQNGRLARLDLRIRPEVDGQVVHRDRAYQRTAAALHEHVAIVRERPAPAVAVADRQYPHPGRRARPPGAAVARAVARLEALHCSDPGVEREGRLEVPFGGVSLEGVEAVDRDPAANHVEVRGGVAEGG